MCACGGWVGWDKTCGGAGQDILKYIKNMTVFAVFLSEIINIPMKQKFLEITGKTRAIGGL